MAQGFQYLFHVFGSCFFAIFSLFCFDFDLICNHNPIDVLHDKIDVLLGVVCFKIVNDIGMIKSVEDLTLIFYLIEIFPKLLLV